MVSKGYCCCSILSFVFLLHIIMASAASSFLSPNHVIVPEGSTGRKLLQEIKSCPVDFEFLNYTIITSQCKSPYPSQPCCSALNKFSCPYVDELSDSTNDCILTMFSYINLIGKYPASLFSNECQGQWLSCNVTTAPAASVNANGGWVAQNVSPLLILMALFPILLFQIL
ncbi:GPI-anchored protein LLG1-like [Macadamia integrifolia]|uniref:GPI-anchored protein LLG1-like n=1 Tax=Macadamia integrifolia TaxID=60698 RepID=UPI001C4F96E9|nr:GPI-anchored protein LLG1-like [Macadamia integrifolia]